MSTVATNPATIARQSVAESLAAAGITASLDAGAFYPQPVGVLVSLPALVGRGLSTWHYTIDVHVVSADPINTTLALDRLCALADDVALALGLDAYRWAGWVGGVNAEPLPSILLTALATAEEAT